MHAAATSCRLSGACLAPQRQPHNRAAAARPAFTARASRPACAPAPQAVRRASPRQPVVAAAGRYEAPNSAAGAAVVEVLADEAAVAAYLCDAVEAAAAAAVAERGVFTLAVPGGSVLKALAGLKEKSIPWDKTKLFFVNHKTVPNDDAGSSYAKARALFLDAASPPEGGVATLTGTDDAEVGALLA